jgi:hypothetical protein
MFNFIIFKRDRISKKRYIKKLKLTNYLYDLSNFPAESGIIPDRLRSIKRKHWEKKWLTLTIFVEILRYYSITPSLVNK